MSTLISPGGWVVEYVINKLGCFSGETDNDILLKKKNKIIIISPVYPPVKSRR